MRYARMLTNAMIGGFLLAAYLTIIVLQLNPRVGLSSLPGLGATLLLSYGLNAAAAFYVLIVVRQLLSSEVLSPGWISVRFLVWLSALASLIGAALMWANLRGFRAVLDATTVRRMTTGAVALTACAAVCVVLVVLHRMSGRRTSRAGAITLAVTVMLSQAVPLMLRGPGAPPIRPARVPPPVDGPALVPDDGRVILLAFEGASLDIIVPAAAQGRLPHFARLLDSGASMHLATLKPTQPATVWTAAATGKLPDRNGVRSAATYYPFGSRDGLEVLPDYCFSHALVKYGFLTQDLHESGDLAALPIWSILSNQSVSVGVVNWPVTSPARPVLGYMVSDAFRGRPDSSVDLLGVPVVWPSEATPVVVAATQQPVTLDVRVPPTPDPQSRYTVQSPCEADRVLDRAALDLNARGPARFRATRFECLDAVGHYYLRYAMPGAFGDVSDDELHHFGSVLPAQYAAADAIVGRELEALAPGDLLLVVSAFGMDPIDPGKRLLERLFGNPELSGTHERAPYGFMMAFGSAVAPGHRARASILDLAPTVLYYLGLPVGRDMDGYARTDLFTGAFTNNRPITFIPTYER